MKLGLLLVLAVAVVVPSISGSRIVNKCEVRAQLMDTIRVSRRLARFKEEIVAIVTCEAQRRSNLNTGLVRVHGTRKTTTTVQPTTPATTGTKTATEAATTKAQTQAPTTGTTTTSTKAQTQAPTTGTTTTSTTTTTTTGAPTTGALTSASAGPKSTAAVGRKKRGASSSETSMDSEEVMEEIFADEDHQFNEQEMEDDDDHLDSGEAGEEDSSSELMDGRRHRRSPHHRRSQKRVPWSLGLYGIFQLSDSHFCSSGYRWSRNVCRAKCSDFADEDITDDVACLVRSHYWRHLLTAASRNCLHFRKIYFHGC